MKKKFLISLIIVLLVGIMAFVVYTNNKKEANNIVEEELMKVLKNERQFISAGDGKEIFLKDYIIEHVNSTGGNVKEYTYVNLDQKGANELIANIGSYSGNLLMLYYNREDNQIYGYFHQFLDIKADGTFVFNYPTAVEHIILEFRPGSGFISNEFAIKELETNKYYINSQNVSKDEYNEFVKKFNEKENATWIKFDTFTRLYIPTTKVSDLNENEIASESIEKSPEIIEKELRKVLNNEEKFITENGNKIFLKDFNEYAWGSEELKEISEYAFVNMDQEGANELVAKTKSSFYPYLILHYENDEIYGYFMNRDKLNNIKNDGTSTSNSGGYKVSNTYGGSYGYFIYKFNKTNYSNILLAGIIDGEYSIDNKAVTEEKFKEFKENQFAKKDITFKNFTGDITINDENNRLDFNENGEMVYSTKDDIVNEYSENPVNYLTLRNDGTVEEYIDFPGVTMKGTYIFEDNKFIATYTEQIEQSNAPIQINEKYVYELRDELLYCELNQYYTEVYRREK